MYKHNVAYLYVFAVRPEAIVVQLVPSFETSRIYLASSSHSSPVQFTVINSLDESATAVENMRVINEKKLEILKEQVKNFATALTQNENWHNIDKIKELLLIYKLRGVDLRNEYSVPVVK